MALKRIFGKFSIVGQFWSFMKVRKRWWLAPLILILLILAIFVILVESTAIAPFIYAIF